MSRYLLTILLFCISGLSSVSASLPAGLSVNIEAVRSGYDSNDKLEIRVSYRNDTDQTIRFLAWNTALEGVVSHDFLDVVFEGARLHYIGRHVKRLPPSDVDYISLAAKETVEAIVDLEGAYPIQDEGEYLITYKVDDLQGDSLSKQKPAVLNLLESKPIKLTKQTPIIDASCNATQVAQINEALVIAGQIASRASSDLDNAPVEQRPNAERYVEWFGAFTEGRYNNVALGMRRIAAALANQRIGFDCTCDDPRRQNLFAFVFTNDPFNMNVCPVFFRVAPAGTDSRSGTIVHEISHFNVVAATDDFSSALDQRGSRALAISSPTSAVRNANAFEYFAENTPFLSMPAPSSTNGGGDGDPADVIEEPEPEDPTIVAPIVDLVLDE